jgi:hypothetical protein
LLRSIDRFVEPWELRRDLAPFYRTMGRPSVAPGLMIRMLIIGYCSLGGGTGGDWGQVGSDRLARSKDRYRPKGAHFWSKY